VSVPVKPVADILSEAGLNQSDVGLVWMDIEGYEPVACRSMASLMSRRVPLYMEFTPIFYGPELTRDFVAALSSFYEDCIVFFDVGEQDMKVRDLPGGIDQYDVLFLP
jgi:hypothetical protein